MNAHELDLAIARAEGRLDALREMRQLVEAQAVEAAASRERALEFVAEVNGRAPAPPRITLAEEEPEQEAPKGPTDHQRVRQERAQRILGHAKKADEEATRAPAEEFPAGRGLLGERRKKIAQHLSTHGATKYTDLIAVAGCPKGSMMAVLNHPWFVKDERGFTTSRRFAGRSSSTTEGPPAVPGARTCAAACWPG